MFYFKFIKKIFIKKLLVKIIKSFKPCIPNETILLYHGNPAEFYNYNDDLIKKTSFNEEDFGN